MPDVEPNRRRQRPAAAFQLHSVRAVGRPAAVALAQGNLGPSCGRCLGIYIEASGGICPLTWLENDFRRQAGQTGYADSFVEHYLLPLIYPAGLTRELQWLFAALVLLLNLALYGWLFWRRRRLC